MLRFTRFIGKFGFKMSKEQGQPLLVEPSKRKWVGGWLVGCALGVFSMIIVGGYTRLTHSGLSIVDWSPYTKVYPKTDEAWNFNLISNREQANECRSVQKDLYCVYLGYLFFFPFAFFTYKKWLKPRLRNRLLLLFGLGGLQGAIGYWMVKSGIHEKPQYQSRPRVSPYRLSLHLMMATFIYSGLMWNSFAVLVNPSAANPNSFPQIKRTRLIALFIIKCLLLNIFTGALVAGIDAGKVYNTWPLMNNEVIPSQIKNIQPKSFFQNKALVQFNHRNMAYITQSLSLYLGYYVFKHRGILPKHVSFAALLVLTLINYQAFSGIITLLNLVPPEKANMHQMTAIITLSSALYLAYIGKAIVNK